MASCLDSDCAAIVGGNGPDAVSWERNGAGGHGYFWWIRENGSYEAVGIFGQSIMTFKDDRVVIVINSAWPVATSKEYNAARTAFINALDDTAKSI